MFPAEKPALHNTVVRGLTGHSINGDAISMYSLLDEASLNKIVENTASRVWRGFVTFGSATAGIFGILLVIRIVKLVVDTAIHGYALHTAYGCSMHLLGAVWSSVTHLLLYLARGPINKQDNIQPNEISSPTPTASENLTTEEIPEINKSIDAVVEPVTSTSEIYS